MDYIIKAACVSHSGNIRGTNEDNFCFGGEFMPIDHAGTERILCLRQSSGDGLVFGIFDGMGGENYGEVASYLAAKNSVLVHSHSLDSCQALEDHAQKLNAEVVQEAESRLTKHMGTTMVMLSFYKDYVYLCNVGDSKAFQLRGDQLEQISKDHVDSLYLLIGDTKRKPSLSQYLGVDPEDFLVEPYTTEISLRKGDRYLICSDGLSDMVSADEIKQILKSSSSPEICAEELLKSALHAGGKDNITVIICEAS